MKITEPFKCSLCGWTDNRKKPYPYENVNEHFINAEAIWCPRNACKEAFERVVPQGYVLNEWHDYGGWYTLEKQTNVIDIETARAVLRAKEIKRIGLEMLRSQKEE